MAEGDARGGQHRRCGCRPRAQVAGHRPNDASPVVGGGSIAIAATQVRQSQGAIPEAAAARHDSFSMRVAAVAMKVAAGRSTAIGDGIVPAPAFGAARWCRRRAGSGSAR